MSRYWPSIDESSVAEGAVSSSQRADSIPNVSPLPRPGESAAENCVSPGDYLKLDE